MNTWPSIKAPSYPLSEDYIKPQIKGQFEAGYVQSRPKGTIGKTRWTLRWGALGASDYGTLLAFVEANMGDVFYWTHPQTAVTHQVRFVDDTLKSVIFAKEFRIVELALEQAT